MNLFDSVCTRTYVSTKNSLSAFCKNEQGVTAIEYAIIAVAISTIVLAAFSSGTLTGAISGAMTKVTTNLTTAKGS